MIEEKRFIDKFLAIIEVFIITFLCVPLLTLGIYRLFPNFEAWQTGTSGFVFPVFVDVVMVGLSVLAILLRRKKLMDYGLCFKPVKCLFQFSR
jgi:hypothetical protein